MPVDQELHFVLDTYATYKTTAVQEFVDGHEGRVQFHFTPTHASWLNQIELWFSTVTRRVLHLTCRHECYQLLCGTERPVRQLWAEG